MKRRTLLKGLSVVASGKLCSTPAWAMFGMDEVPDANAPLAVAIRGLRRKDGKLFQPIQITIPHSGSATTALVSLNGTEVDRRDLTGGLNTFAILAEPVTAPKDVTVEVTVDGNNTRRIVKLEPVRKVKVYVLPHSHHDLGYTDQQANVEVKQMDNITHGIELARKTADYPEGSRFVWNLEVLWGADLFLRRKSPEEKAAFIEAIKKGWVSLNGMYANELTGLCRPEELLQLFRFGTELGKQCGVTVNSAMASDVPGFTWGTVTAMSQAGIRYFSTAPNYFDRIGKLMVQYQDKPFWWVSPSGKEKVLVWIPWTGYALSHVMKLDRAWVGKYQERLDSVDFPYEISYIRWSGHGDNAAPDPDLCEFTKSWNQDFEWPKFVISSTSDAFSDFEKHYGDKIPELKGDFTPFWEDGAGSSAQETKMNRAAADRLVQGEALSALLSPATYPAAKFNEAWRNVLLYSEHTWGAWSSVSDSETPFTTKQWDVKRDFAVNAEKLSKDLLSEILALRTPGKETSAIDVHNSTSWPRSEIVYLSKEMSSNGDHVKDSHGKSVPSQRLSTGELAFFADNIPAFGAARFHISSAKPHLPEQHVSANEDSLENGLLRARIDMQTGNMMELTLKDKSGKSNNLIDISGGEQANEYLFLEGKDVSKLQKSGLVKVVIEENGPLVACLRIESSAPGCNSMVRRIRLAAGADWLELNNVLDKKRAPMNPHPGDADQGGEFAQHGSKESIQFAFPFNVSNGKMRMDIPLAEMRPEVDQLPGTCKNWLPVGRWIDVSNADQGVTWVTLDAPLVEVGEVSANMLGSQRDPSIWRDYIEPTQKFYSWVMNNHWGTNYRAYQEGIVEFRYALRPHSGYSAAAASRLAIGLSQPLIVSVASSSALTVPALKIEPADVLAITLKPSEDGKAWIVRLFGASGEDRRAKLLWSPGNNPRLSLSDLSEKIIKPLEQNEIEVAGWDLVTIRADRTS